MFPPEEGCCNVCGGPLTTGGRCPKCLAANLLMDWEEEAPREEDHRPKIGPYRLERKLGVGGFGTVWLAEQREPFRRQVAVKILKAGMDSDQILARFRGEQQALASLNHHHITKVYDAGITEEGRPYFAMEVVDGVPLDECFEQMTLEARLKLFLQVCEAIEHAHEHGIIHRDLKPSNILVRLHHCEDGTVIGHPKVIDFGIAKATEQPSASMVTTIQQVMGTPEYMSPEQAGTGGAHVDMRTDVYSLGMILYQLVAGRLPWAFGRQLSQASIREQILRRVPERPSQMARKHRPPEKRTTTLRSGAELDWIVLKALAHEPERRYQSVQDLAKDIVCLLEGRPISARSPSRIYRWRKFTQRHPGWVWGSLACLALVVTTIALSLHYAHTHTQEVRSVPPEEDKLLYESDLAFRLGMERCRGDAPRDGVAFFCEALRKAPNHHAAAQALLHELAFRVFPTEEGEGARVLKLRHKRKPVTFASFSHDNGSEFGTITNDGTFHLWSTETGRLRPFPLKFFFGSYPFDYHQERELVGFSRADGLCQFLQLDPVGKHPVELQLDGRLTQGRFSRSGDGVLTGEEDGTVRYWDRLHGQEQHSWKLHTAPILNMALTEDDHYAAVASEDHSASILDLVSGNLVAMLEHAGPVHCVALSPDQRTLVTGSMDNTARLWDLSTGEAVSPWLRHEVEAAHQGIIASFSHDGELVITGGSKDGCVRIWDAKTGEVADEPLAHGSAVLSLAVDPDRRRILVGTAEHGAHLWDVRTGERIAPGWPLPDAVTLVAFAPLQSQIALIAANGETHLVDLAPSRPTISADFLTLAEAIAGKQINTRGILIDLPSHERDARLKAARDFDRFDGIERMWVSWLLDDPERRGRSPFVAR